MPAGSRLFSTPVFDSVGGADPLVRAGPPGPAPTSIDKHEQQADVGVGRGPGGPPHLAFDSNFRIVVTRQFPLHWSGAISRTTGSGVTPRSVLFGSIGPASGRTHGGAG